MNQDHHSRNSLILAVSVSLLVLLLASGTELTLANTEPRQVPQEPVQNAPTGWYDDGIFEVGVEWINDFPGTDGDRSHWDESCDGLYYDLLGDGWTSGFHFTDWNSWETDFKDESLGGKEDSFVDNVDIAMVCTHGSGTHDDFWNKDLSSVYFGSTHADNHLSPGDAYMAYGDKDLEWLAFDSCSVLSDGGASPYFNRGYWAATMNGLHLLLGFNNTMYVSPPGDGELWGDYMNGNYFLFFWARPPYTVMQSWFSAVDDVQPSVTCARVLANTSNNFNDYLWGKGPVSSDPPTDGYYSYWDHCSDGYGKNEAPASDSQPELLSVPRILVQDRLVDEDYVRNRIASAFGFTGELYSDDMNFYMVDTSGGITLTLQVDRVTGSFSFHNLSELWVPADMAPTLPNDAQAYGFLEEWFKNIGEGLPGVWNRDYRWKYEIEELIDMNFVADGNGGITEQVVDSTPQNVVFTYPRVISGKALTPVGIQQVDYPVFGPGGRLKFYFGGIEGGIVQPDDIIGAQGGTRDVTVGPELVEVLDAPMVWQMYLANRRLSIPEVPWIADTITYDMVRLGYYEMPYMQHQSELIPVYEFMADFSNGGKAIAEDVAVYVPASIEYLPPEVTILSPLDGSMQSSLEPIYFEGKITGGTPPYTLQWSSSEDGFLSDQEIFTANLSTAFREGAFNPNNVSLTVTDSNGSSATDNVSLMVKPLFWLPFLVR